MFDNYPDVLTVVDVKTALCIGKNAVYALIKNKQIKAKWNLSLKHINTSSNTPTRQSDVL